MHRKSLLATGLALCALGIAAVSSAGNWWGDLLSGPPPRMVIIWVDKSDSITSVDWDLYNQSFDAVVNALQPGDRAVLATVGTETLTRFAAVADETLEKTNIKYDDEDSAATIKTKLKGAFAKLKTLPLDKTTDLLDTFNASDQLFASAPTYRSHQLVYFSDMVHQANRIDFAKNTLNDAYYQKLVRERKDHNLFPRNLAGVDVFVVGATAKDATKYAEIKNFWSKYVRDAGGNLSDAHYGRSVAVVKP